MVDKPNDTPPTRDELNVVRSFSTNDGTIFETWPNLENTNGLERMNDKYF